MSSSYNSDKYRSDNFDYESAREDLYDAGLDPDYLSSRNREERDRFLKKNGFDPHSYGSRYEADDGSSDDNDSGCFLTTACIRAKGLPDDCMELQTLRAYRDDRRCTASRSYPASGGAVSEVNTKSPAGARSAFSAKNAEKSEKRACTRRIRAV